MDSSAREVVDSTDTVGAAPTAVAFLADLGEGADRAPSSMVEMAHDLRSPLTAILFLVEHMRSGRSGPLTPLLDRQLAIVHDATSGLSAMVTDLIELERQPDTEAPVEDATFSLRAVSERVMDIVRPIAEYKHLQLRLATPSRDLRNGDAVMLHRVLLNLMTNAVKFTTRGTVSLVVEDVDLRRVRFSIVDEGSQSPMTASDANLTAFPSMGLGLSIVRRLLASHGSSLQLSRGRNEGTRATFVMTL